MSLASLFPASRIDDMRRHIARFASKFGVPDIVISDHIPSTRKALAMSEFARDRGRLEEFRASVMNGYWIEGLDIENQDVLRLLAGRAGLDPDETLGAAADPRYIERLERAAREAHEMDVAGIPTFFFGTREKIVGCQPYESLIKAAEAAGARLRQDHSK